MFSVCVSVHRGVPPIMDQVPPTPLGHGTRQGGGVYPPSGHGTRQGVPPLDIGPDMGVLGPDREYTPSRHGTGQGHISHPSPDMELDRVVPPTGKWDQIGGTPHQTWDWTGDKPPNHPSPTRKFGQEFGHNFSLTGEGGGLRLLRSRRRTFLFNILMMVKPTNQQTASSYPSDKSKL